MPESLRERIMRHEGFCATPRPDAKGMWQIGYGHDLEADQVADWQEAITLSDGLVILDSDIEKVKEECAKAFPWLLGLDEVRASVIHEMAYQMGVHGVSQFKMMIAAIRSQNWYVASRQMISSAWHKETPARCEALASIMLNG